MWCTTKQSLKAILHAAVACVGPVEHALSVQSHARHMATVGGKAYTAEAVLAWCASCSHTFGMTLTLRLSGAIQLDSITCLVFYKRLNVLQAAHTRLTTAALGVQALKHTRWCSGSDDQAQRFYIPSGLSATKRWNSIKPSGPQGNSSFVLIRKYG